MNLVSLSVSLDVILGIDTNSRLIKSWAIVKNNLVDTVTNQWVVQSLHEFISRVFVIWLSLVSHSLGAAIIRANFLLLFDLRKLTRDSFVVRSSLKTQWRKNLLQNWLCLLLKSSLCNLWIFVASFAPESVSSTSVIFLWLFLIDPGLTFR